MPNTPLETDQLQYFLKYCQTAKIRISIECKMLVGIICKLDAPIAAVDLWLLLKGKGNQISMATVYRVLHRLHQMDFVTIQKDSHAEHALYQWKVNDSIE